MAVVLNGKEYSPGTYNLKSIKVKGKELKFLMSELNIYESIFTPCMTGDLVIYDTYNFLSNEPFEEGDVVTISLSYNSDDPIQASVDGEKFNMDMEIIKIKNRIKIKDNVQTYTLKLASTGWSNNIRTRISRSFKNKKYSEIVQKIFDDKFISPAGLKGQLKSKEIEVEETDGMYTVIIPRWKPITCFNWIAQRARKGPAVNFLFWEDKDKFHFESVEKLMKEKASDTYYVRIQNNMSDNKNQEYFNIEEYHYEDTGDVLLYALHGMFSNRMIEYDIIKKKVKDYFPKGKTAENYELGKEFSYEEEFGKLKHTDGNGKPLVPSDVIQTFVSDPGNTRLTVVIKHDDIWENMKFEHEKWVRQRTSQKDSLKYLKLTVYTIGNFKRKAGEKIKIDLPSPEKDAGDKLDKRLQGEYLIASLRRKFNQDQHVCVMELIKDDIFGG